MMLLNVQKCFVTCNLTENTTSICLLSKGCVRILAILTEACLQMGLNYMQKQYKLTLVSENRKTHLLQWFNQQKLFMHIKKANPSKLIFNKTVNLCTWRNMSRTTKHDDDHAYQVLLQTIKILGEKFVS